MKTVVHTQDARRETFNDVPAAECHFLHVDEGLVAAFSHCSDNEIVISNHVGDFVSFDLIFWTPNLMLYVLYCMFYNCMEIPIELDGTNKRKKRRKILG